MPTPFTYTGVCLGSGGGGGGSGVNPGTPYQVTRYDPTGTNIQDSTGSDNPANGPTQWPSGLSVENNAGYRKFPNSPNGTTVNLTVCYDPTIITVEEVTTCPAGSNSVLGIADSGAGTTGNVKVAMFGFHAGVYDGQTTINDWFGPSGTTAGYLTDLGTGKPSNTQVIGHVISLNSGTGTLATSDLFTGDTIAPGGGGSVNTQVCAQVGGIAAYISTTILGCDTFATTDFAGRFLLKSAGFTDTTHAGFYYLTQGPLPAPAPANSIMHYTPTSVTAYSVREPGAACTTSQVWQVASTTTDTNGNTIDVMGCVTLGAGTGTVTSFSAGNLSPLFTTSVATATTTPALTFTLSTVAANLVLAGPTSGGAVAPTYRALVTADLPDVTLRRICMIGIGADNGAVLLSADIAPQLERCQIPYAATIREINVTADAGTPNVVVAKRHCTANPCASNFTVTDLLSSALATAAAGGPACSNTGGTAGLDTFTTCTNTLQNTGIAIGDYIETHTATAGGAAHRISIAIYAAVN